jgi:hypothetical protein
MKLGIQSFGLLAALSVVLAGCSSIPKEKQKDYALLIPDENASSVIDSVGNESFTSFGGSSRDVLPGYHSIQMTTCFGNPGAPNNCRHRNFLLDTKAGLAYKLKSESRVEVYDRFDIDNMLYVTDGAGNVIYVVPRTPTTAPKSAESQMAEKKEKEAKEAYLRDTEKRSMLNGPSGWVTTNKERIHFVRLGTIKKRDLVEINGVPIEEISNITFGEKCCEMEILQNNGTKFFANAAQFVSRIGNSLILGGQYLSIVSEDDDTGLPYLLNIPRSNVKRIEIDNIQAWTNLTGGELIDGTDFLSLSPESSSLDELTDLSRRLSNLDQKRLSPKSRIWLESMIAKVNKYRDIQQTREAARKAKELQDLAIQQAKALQQLASFRKSLSEGDETNCGLVIEKKTKLVKLQLKSSNTEQWVKIDEVLPPDQACSLLSVHEDDHSSTQISKATDSDIGNIGKQFCRIADITIAKWVRKDTLGNGVPRPTRVESYGRVKIVGTIENSANDRIQVRISALHFHNDERGVSNTRVDVENGKELSGHLDSMELDGSSIKVGDIIWKNRDGWTECSDAQTRHFSEYGM